MPESKPNAVNVPVPSWAPPMLTKDHNAQYVLFLGGHQGYLIDDEAQLEEVQGAFGESGYLGGMLGRLVTTIAFLCTGMTWYVVDSSHVGNAFIMTYALTPYVLNGIWARRFLNRQTAPPRRVHCITEKGPPFQRITRRWAWYQISVVSIFSLAGLITLPAVFNRSVLLACLQVSLIAGLSWLLGAGPLRVLRNQSSVPWNKNAD